MAYDYDALYRTTRHALGGPNPDILEFFRQLSPPLRVLDLGCGQGRDAIDIARLGHGVIGVDLSPAGIAAMESDAGAEGLAVRGIVADLAIYEPAPPVDVVVLDRTLHMLEPSTRATVVQRMAGIVPPGGWVLIVDEPSNMDGIEAALTEVAGGWQVSRKGRNTIFCRRMAVPG